MVSQWNLNTENIAINKMECYICYETVEEGEIRVLECAHSLCQRCLSRLRVHICPFCRTSIERSHQDIVSHREGPSSVSAREEDLEHAFSMIRRGRRRMRRRRERPSQLPVLRHIPPLLSDEEVAELRTAASVAQLSDSESKSRSDDLLQRARRERARWREGSMHRRSHTGAR